MLRGLITAALLITNALLMAWIGWTACPNRTEPGHMAATVYLWDHGQFDVFHVNPPLTRLVSGLPVVLSHPNRDWSWYSERPRARCEEMLGPAFVMANSSAMNRWCFALARWSLIPFLLLGGYCGYRFSRELYGPSAAMLFLVVWCFSPTMVSWGATICPDAVSAALGVVALYAFHRWLRMPSWSRASVAGLCLGLLPLTKLTWIIAFGLWPLMWLLWQTPDWLGKVVERSLLRPPLRQLAAILVVALYVLNMGYLFNGTGRPLGQYQFMSHVLRGSELTTNMETRSGGGNRFAGTWLGRIPVPLPAEFVQGIDTQRHDFERTMWSYLRGQWAPRGWWYYYLYALAIKVPLGIWCLAAMATMMTFFGREIKKSWRDEMVLLLPAVSILVLVSSQTGFNHHSRYVLLALPLFFIWMSKVGRVFDGRREQLKEAFQASVGYRRRRVVPALRLAVILALAWLVGSSVWTYPHSLSYFNELAGGPTCGAEHLLDSNIDWGQDLWYLKQWLNDHPGVTLAGTRYYGQYRLAVEGLPTTPPPAAPEPNGETHLVDVRETSSRSKNGAASADAAAAILSDIGPKPGWYALSVNKIHSRNPKYEYFQWLKPVAMTGYSIYVYNVTLDDANHVRRRLNLPELTEESHVSAASARSGNVRNRPMSASVQNENVKSASLSLDGRSRT